MSVRVLVLGYGKCTVQYFLRIYYIYFIFLFHGILINYSFFVSMDHTHPAHFPIHDRPTELTHRWFASSFLATVSPTLEATDVVRLSIDSCAESVKNLPMVMLSTS